MARSDCGRSAPRGGAIAVIPLLEGLSHPLEPPPPRPVAVASPPCPRKGSLAPSFATRLIRLGVTSARIPRSYLPENVMAQDRMTELREFAARYTAAWCSQDAASVAAFFAPGGSLAINGGIPSMGRSAITRAVQGFMTAFPDLQVYMDDLLEIRAK